MYTKRELIKKINKINKSILLIGPRQTGKSTFFKRLQPDLTINLMDQEIYLKYLSQPGLIKEVTTGNKRIFIDEIQRIPSLLNTIQTLIDNNPQMQFYLTGSSARKLKRGQVNLLPGRLVTYAMGPLSPHELKEDFNLNKALSIGLLPGVYWEEEISIAQKTLRSYAATYLKEEVQAEALTRNLEGFSRFFNIIASRSGDFIDYTKFSSQAMIERTSSKRYFEILIDTLILHSLEPFSKNYKKRIVQHPRYYFFDVGVLNGCLNNFSASEDRKGRLFEHLFLQSLIASAQSQDDEYQVSVYRTRSGAEVDFIFEKGQELFAIEVKATQNIGPSDLNGLKSFSNFYNKPHQSLLIYLGEEERSIDGVLVKPFHKGLNFLGY